MGNKNFKVYGIIENGKIVVQTECEDYIQGYKDGLKGSYNQNNKKESGGE